MWLNAFQNVTKYPSLCQHPYGHHRHLLYFNYNHVAGMHIFDTMLRRRTSLTCCFCSSLENRFVDDANFLPFFIVACLYSELQATGYARQEEYQS